MILVFIYNDEFIYPQITSDKITKNLCIGGDTIKIKQIRENKRNEVSLYKHCRHRLKNCNPHIQGSPKNYNFAFSNCGVFF